MLQISAYHACTFFRFLILKNVAVIDNCMPLSANYVLCVTSVSELPIATNV